MPENIVTKTEFAKILNRKPSYVSELVKYGRVVLDESGKKILVAESLALIEESKDLSKTGVAQRHATERAEKTATPPPEINIEGKAGSIYQQSKAMREKYNAMLTKIEYDKAIGKLLDADDVKNAVIHAALITRSRLENLPAQLSTRLAVEQDERQIHNILTDTIEHVLTEFSRYCSKLGQHNEPASN